MWLYTVRSSVVCYFVHLRDEGIWTSDLETLQFRCGDTAVAWSNQCICRFLSIWYKCTIHATLWGWPVLIDLSTINQSINQSSTYYLNLYLHSTQKICYPFQAWESFYLGENLQIRAVKITKPIKQTINQNDNQTFSHYIIYVLKKVTPESLILTDIIKDTNVYILRHKWQNKVDFFVWKFSRNQNVSNVVVRCTGTRDSKYATNTTTKLGLNVKTHKVRHKMLRFGSVK